jgi:hypothetical protein
MTCPHCQPRSSPQHRRIFKVISAAFNQWRDPEIVSAEHLRAWLLAKAQYCNVQEIELDHPSDKGLRKLEALIRAAGAYAFTRVYRDRVYMFTPKSMRFDKLSHKDACALFEKIEAIICDELAIESCDQLLHETENAA